MNKYHKIEETKLVCFVIPYFGKLPKNFELFLKTCSYNKDFDWLIFTDDKNDFECPENVFIKKCTFEDMKKKIQEKFDFEINLNTPKKLCDFKPAYGYIFSSELKNYPFWGYCDLDQYFGNLKTILNKSFLKEYDKIFSLGHMTIYRNTKFINELFLKEYSNNISNEKIIHSFTEVASDSENKLFDEWPRNSVNINVLAKQYKLNVYYGWPMVDVVPFKSDLLKSIYNDKENKWEVQDSYTCFLWKDGTLYAVSIKEGKIYYEEIIYVHLQKRELKIDQNVINSNLFIIYPNKIKTVSQDNLKQEIRKIAFLGKIRKCLMIDEIKHDIRQIILIWKYRINHYILRKI